MSDWVPPSHELADLCELVRQWADADDAAYRASVACAKGRWHSKQLVAEFQDARHRRDLRQADLREAVGRTRAVGRSR